MKRNDVIKVTPIDTTERDALIARIDSFRRQYGYEYRRHPALQALLNHTSTYLEKQL